MTGEPATWTRQQRRERMAQLVAAERQPTPEEVADLAHLLDAIHIRQAQDEPSSNRATP